MIIGKRKGGTQVPLLQAAPTFGLSCQRKEGLKGSGEKEGEDG